MRAHGNKEFWLAALRADGPAFRAAVAEAAPDAPVPSCPEWTVAQLTGHLASIYGWVAGHVGRGVTTRPEPRSREAVTATVAEFDERFGALVTLLDSLDPEMPAWNWAPQSKKVAFWHRRMAHETAVHRWDAQMAVGLTEPLEAKLAADGLIEVLDTWLPAGRGTCPTHRQGMVALSAADLEQTWHIRLRPGGGVALLDTDTILDDDDLHERAAAARSRSTPRCRRSDTTSGAPSRPGLRPGSRRSRRASSAPARRRPTRSGARIPPSHSSRWSSDSSRSRSRCARRSTSSGMRPSSRACRNTSRSASSIARRSRPYTSEGVSRRRPPRRSQARLVRSSSLPRNRSTTASGTWPSRASSAASRSWAARLAACWTPASASASSRGSSARIRSRRAIQGRVTPCSTSVPTITEKASQTNSDRGYSAPPGRLAGSASAAASVTTPRIPAQEISVGTRSGGAGSRARTRGASRTRYVAGYSHTNRLTTTTPSVTTVAMTAVRHGVFSSSRMPRNWSPTRRNTAPSRRNLTIRQNASICSRDRADISDGYLCPRYSPATTTATTPEACTASADAYTTNGASSDTELSSNGLVIFRWIFARTRPPSAPMSTPPTEARSAFSAMSSTDSVWPIAAATATRKMTSAVASLIRLSPSRIETIRRGSPIRRATAVAATASGGATIAPSAKQAASGTFGSSPCITNATQVAVKRTSPTANSRIGRRLNRNAGTEVSMAATYSSGGRMPTSTISGSSRISGIPGMNDSPTPTTTSRIGDSTPSREASAETTTTTSICATRRAYVLPPGQRLGGVPQLLGEQHQPRLTHPGVGAA